MRVTIIKQDISELQMYIIQGHHDRLQTKLINMSNYYTSIAERDYIRGELLRVQIYIPECFGGNNLAGLYKTLNERLYLN